MKLSLTSWSLRACSLEEAVGLSKVLGVHALDLGYFYGPALDKAALLADPDAMAAKVRALDIAVPCFYHLFGAGLADRNLADPASLAANLADFAQVMRFCKAADIPTVFVLPGVVNPGQSRAEALAVSADALNALKPIADDAGVTLTVEPHVHSYLESPDITRRLLERVDGLKLTLDYAHYVCLGWRQEEIDPLAPHAAHVHLRQARPGVLQTKIDLGTINFGAQFGTLRDAGFDGWLALEVVHQDYMGTLYDDVLTETAAIRDRFRAWRGN
ncbi:MAG: sugar phosphate isomerase/epimerase family protein [Alphaproteobacteria bacterium]